MGRYLKSDAAAVRARVLGFLAKLGRPVTGGEIRVYCLTSVDSAEIRGLMAEGLVLAECRPEPRSPAGVSWTYRLNP